MGVGGAISVGVRVGEGILGGGVTSTYGVGVGRLHCQNGSPFERKLSRMMKQAIWIFWDGS